jgi:hypothetical protein
MFNVVEPSHNAKRGVTPPQAGSLGWWDAPAVTPSTTCAPHTPERTMLEQTRKAAHLYTLFVLRIWWLEGKHPDDSLPHNSAPSAIASGHAMK